MIYINEINAAGKIAVDDTILVKGVPATAGSKMLENFKPLFSAEAVERLEKAGYDIAGKTNVGEFGLDLLGETSYFAPETQDGKLVGAAAAISAEDEAVTSEEPYSTAAFHPPHQLFTEHLPHRVNNVS